MPSITLRNATENDFQAIYEMVCELEEEKLDVDVFRGIFADNIRDPQIHYLVAIDEGKIIGFVSVYIQQFLHHNGNVAEIHELFVNSNLRGKGIGKQLIQAAKEIADQHNCKTFEVACNLKRKKSHEFYEREGFTPTHFKFTQQL